MVFAGCAKVPFTGRSALMLMSKEQEIAMGDEAYAQLLKESKIAGEGNEVKNRDAALIKKVGEKIAAIADKPEYKWEFVLIDDSSTVNAFCLPGGKVAFYTGILPLCADENGIAVVMSHEIGHAVARHGAERMSQGMLADAAGQVLANVVHATSTARGSVIMNAYGLATNLGVMLPFSRQHEYEADFIGICLMAKAGYDPSAALGFWKRMSELSKGNIPEFLSTHPSDEKRVAEIERRLPEALKFGTTGTHR